MAERAQPPSSQSDTLRDIQRAWDEAQAHLALLREQVEHATSLAQLKVQSNLNERDLDRAYRELGEAVWAEVSKGKLQLPAGLAPVKKALDQVTQRIRAQNASINDLLAEGADIAQRLQEKMARPSKAVAPPQKRR